jgi:Golgi apyrase
MLPVLDPVSGFHRRGPVPSFSHIPKKYAVIIDAGSSGSRIQVFSWSDPKILQEQTRSALNTTILSSIPHISQNSEHNLKINPGISSYAGKHIKKLWSKHLLRLVKHAEKIVPKKLQYETPIHLLATAGMRLLPLDDQKQILAESCRLLQEKTSFYLPDCESHVSIIDGETEALYGWISLNYLLGTFDSFNHETQELLPGQSSKILPPQTPSYGFMDMGGASMQVAFSPNSTESERHLNDLYHVRLRTIEGTNQNWRVFVSSWLGFGANEAKRRFAESLLSYNSQIGNTNALPEDPCYPRGRTHEVKINENKTATFTGQGDLLQCLRAMQPLLRKSEPCKDDPCLFNGIHVPAIDFETDRFVGVSEYWYTANDLFKLGGHYDFEVFSKHVSQYCGSTWETILTDKKHGKYPDVSDKTLDSACFKASWVINILHSGFGLPFNSKNSFGLDAFTSLQQRDLNSTELDKRTINELVTPFQSVSAIEDTELTWMLGKAVLYASSQVPPIHTKTPDVGFLPADMTENHYVLGGEAVGVLPPINPHTDVGSILFVLILLALAIPMLVYYFLRHKRGFNSIFNKIRVGQPSKFISTIISKMRSPNDGAYQRVLEEGNANFDGDANSPGGPAQITTPSASTFHMPFPASAKSTSSLDLNKFYQHDKVPSRPSSRLNLRNYNGSNLDLSEVEPGLTRNSSRLFRTQSIERL